MNEQDAQVLAAAAVFKHCLEIMVDRGKKYGDPEDAFIAFKGSAEIADTDVTQGIMTRFGDKVGRIRQGLRNYRNADGGPSFSDESLKDSLTDGINYLAILYIWLETGGGNDFQSFLETAGMVPKPQLVLPIEENAVNYSSPEQQEGWFKKFIK